MVIDLGLVVSITVGLLTIAGVVHQLGKNNQKLEQSIAKIDALEKNIDDTRNLFFKKIDVLNEFKNSAQAPIEHFSKVEMQLLDRLSSVEKNEIALRESITNILKKDEADTKYVAKEIFNEFKKHMDTKFDHLEEDIKEVKQDTKLILDILKKDKDD